MFKLACVFAISSLAMGCKKAPQDVAKVADPTEAVVVAEPPIEAPPAIDAGFTLDPAPAIAALPLGLPATPSPSHNPTTPEKVALGTLLFAETGMSASGNHSCTSCHDPQHGFSSSAAADSTDKTALNMRHTPALWNLAYASSYNWDGRYTGLEEQLLSHSEGQLGLSVSAALKKLAGSPLYRAHFKRAFGAAPGPNQAVEALASYLRVLRAGNAPWDRYEAGDDSAVGEAAKAGSQVFNTLAGCATCHPPPFYTDFAFHPVLPMASGGDEGRKYVTKAAADAGRFKTPGLRNLSSSAPYFHNGSAGSLGEVIDAKVAVGSPRLTPVQKSQLIEFLLSLSAQ